MIEEKLRRESAPAATSMESADRSKSMAKDQAAGTGFGEGQYSPTVRVAFDPERN